MMADILMDGSSSSRELSSGSVSGEESEFWARICSSLIHHVVIGEYMERDSWSN